LIKRDQELFEKIEAYLHGDLSSEALADFERLLEKDLDLQQEVKKHHEMEQAISDPEREHLQQKLDQVKTELRSESKYLNTFSRTYRKYWAVAAVILLILGVFAVFQLSKPGYEDLYSAYYKPYPAQDIMRGEGEVTPSASFMKDYRQGDYGQALDKLEKAINLNSKNGQLWLYLGNCHMQLNNLQLALDAFQRIDPKGDFGKDAQWFSALCYLKMGKAEPAKNELGQLVSIDNIHRGNAREILEKME